MGEVVPELRREAAAQLVGVRGLLALQDALVLLLLGGGLEALPGQAAAQEVHEHEAQGLNVVAAALLDAQVRVDRGVARRARQVLALRICEEAREGKERWISVENGQNGRGEIENTWAALTYLQVHDVSARAGVLILLRQAKINDVTYVLCKTN